MWGTTTRPGARGTVCGVVCGGEVARMAHGSVRVAPMAKVNAPRAMLGGLGLKRRIPAELRGILDMIRLHRSPSRDVKTRDHCAPTCAVPSGGDGPRGLLRR